MFILSPVAGDGGSWSQSCSPLHFDAGLGLLVATCGTLESSLGPYLLPSYINASLCAPAVGIDTFNGLMTCHNGAVAAGMPGQSVESRGGD